MKDSDCDCSPESYVLGYVWSSCIALSALTKSAESSETHQLACDATINAIPTDEGMKRE